MRQERGSLMERESSKETRFGSLGLPLFLLTSLILISGFIWLVFCIFVIGNRSISGGIVILLLSGISLAFCGFIIGKGISEKDNLHEKKDLK